VAVGESFANKLNSLYIIITTSDRIAWK